MSSNTVVMNELSEHDTQNLIHQIDTLGNKFVTKIDVLISKLEKHVLPASTVIEKKINPLPESTVIKAVNPKFGVFAVK